MQHIIAKAAFAAEFIHQIVWGPAMVAFMLFCGIWFSAGTGFFQLRKLALWLRSTLVAIFCSPAVHNKKDPHTISQFQAFATALAGTLGTGNIVGVATAITIGGTGAIFWMWVSAFFGMMTKYAENLLGNYYRRKNQDGSWFGGPMAYIERGLGCRWLALLFAAFCAVSSFGIGNMAQANSIAGALCPFGVPPFAAGIAVAVLTGMVILGGIKRIAAVTERLVPLMAVLYTCGGIIIIFLNRQRLPEAFASIFSEAFAISPAAGGVAGFSVSRAMRFGVARGIFSNEAGLGSSAIVNSASNVKEPVEQGMWGIFEVFADTIVMCSITALAIITSQAHLLGVDGAEMSIAAFSSGFGSAGQVFVAVSITFFAFSTLLGWSYYGQQAVSYLLGPKSTRMYQRLFILMAAVGCVARLEFVWGLSDTFNGLMAIPNLVAVLFLSKDVFSQTKNYLKQKSRPSQPPSSRSK